MPGNVHICPFSGQGCRNCALYRGRHGYIKCNDADGTPEARILKKVEIDWQERFKETLHNREEDIPVIPDAEKALEKTGDEKNYNITLIVFDKETGERRVCSISEARAWDWENREKVRSIGPWHIYSFERLLSVLAYKANSGCEEVVLIEAPFYMGC